MKAPCRGADASDTTRRSRVRVRSRRQRRPTRDGRIAPGRPLQFDDVAVGVRYVHGRSFALGAESRRRRADRYSGLFEVVAQRRFVESLEAKAQVIEIATFAARRRTTGA